MPLVKVVTVPDKSGAAGEFQFKHLSFQEFLFVDTFKSGHLQANGLPVGFEWGTKTKQAEFLRLDFYHETITKLGGAMTLLERSPLLADD